MRESINFEATRDFSGLRPPVKQLRRELTRLSKVVPDFARIEVENVKSEAGYWYTRLVARWTQYA